MTYNFQKHHRRSIRLPGYDYTQPGSYFITICTYQRQCWFGNILKGKMHLNRLGDIVRHFWQALPHRFSFIQLDTFIVMPNHFHGILAIADRKDTLPYTPTQEQFGQPVPGSIPTVVRSFKSAVTRRINMMRRTSKPPIWQRNYYESVIRNEKELVKVRDYIINNPLQWELDEENPHNYPNVELIELDLYF